MSGQSPTYLQKAIAFQLALEVKHNPRVLVEIGAGQGKSIVVAIIAGINAVQGKWPLIFAFHDDRILARDKELIDDVLSQYDGAAYELVTFKTLLEKAVKKATLVVDEFDSLIFNNPKETTRLCQDALAVIGLTATPGGKHGFERSLLQELRFT